MKRTIFLVLAAWAMAEDWPQWGGPHRDFKVDTKGLAAQWPSNGPRQLWSRALGEGYSGIAAEGGVLYTMYREGDQEAVIALDARSGKTLWEHRYSAPLDRSYALENGPGPHSTPLVVRDRLFTVGTFSQLFCLDKKTGKVIWSHNLIQNFQADKLGRGYANSPIAYKNTVILPIGGKGHGVIALNQKDGTVVWKKGDLPNAFSSPILINVDGQEQLVLFMSNIVAGVDPNTGDVLWTHPHQTDWGLNISTPVWGEGNLLFLSSAYGGGSRVLQLSRVNGQTAVKELWFTNRLRIHHGNAIRLGDYVYGSSGDFGPAPLVTVNVKTGQEAWRDRSFSKANMVYADGKLILLDEDGRLALATVSPSGLHVISKVDLLRRNAWTPPTLAGTQLYVRDRRSIAALDLR